MIREAPALGFWTLILRKARERLVSLVVDGYCELFYFSIVKSVSVPQTWSGYVFEQLAASTNYTVFLRAKSLAGEGPASLALSVTIRDPIGRPINEKSFMWYFP